VISFRYHIVSIVSVFLALAVGVALGGGPLKGEVDNTLVQQVKTDRKEKAALKAEISSLHSGSDFNDSFARTVAPDLLSGTLTGRPVTLVVLPGAEQSSVSSLSQLIGEAGGTVAGTVRAGKGLIDPSNKQLVDQLSSQLMDGTTDVSVPNGASGYERMGTLLARAIGTNADGGAKVDDTSNSILSGFSTAGLLSVEGDMSQRGSLVMFIGGPGEGTSEQRQGANSIITTIAEAVDANTDGVVVAGPIASAHAGGLVAAVREDVVAARDVSTVDVLGRVSGEVVAVMALAEQAHGKTGHYGAVDAADGAMPGANASAQ
jgi:hypothetical protein